MMMAPFNFNNGLNLALFSIVFLSLSSRVCVEASSKSLARGWGDHFEWHSLSDGLELAAKVNKPIMVIIHKTWCGACKRLMGEFSQNKDIPKLAKDFVFVNLENDEEPEDNKYAPDGGYIPRILFVDSKANVKGRHLNEQGHHKYRYFYSNADQVFITMKKVLLTWHYHGDKIEPDGEGGQVYDEL